LARLLLLVLLLLLLLLLCAPPCLASAQPAPPSACCSWRTVAAAVLLAARAGLAALLALSVCRNGAQLLAGWHAAPAVRNDSARTWACRGVVRAHARPLQGGGGGETAQLQTVST
jgi:hypothetical protein